MQFCRPRRVCQDLDFVDGKAVCCSAYGSVSYYISRYATHLNYTMHCKGDELSSGQCISQTNNCSSADYASVVCFNSTDFVDTTSELMLASFSLDVLFICCFSVSFVKDAWSVYWLNNRCFFGPFFC